MFFESEVTLPVEFGPIVTKDFYHTLKIPNFNCHICESTISRIRQRADQCMTCAERLIELNERKEILNDVDSEATIIIYNNE